LFVPYGISTLSVTRMTYLELYAFYVLYRYFDCAPMHGLFTPIHKLSFPRSNVVTSDARSPLPYSAASPRQSASQRRTENTVCVPCLWIAVQ